MLLWIQRMYFEIRAARVPLVQSVTISEFLAFFFGISGVGMEATATNNLRPFLMWNNPEPESPKQNASPPGALVPTHIDRSSLPLQNGSCLVKSCTTPSFSLFAGMKPLISPLVLLIFTTFDDPKPGGEGSWVRSRSLAVQKLGT